MAIRQLAILTIYAFFLADTIQAQSIMPKACFTYHFIGIGCSPSKGQKGNMAVVVLTPCNIYRGLKHSWIVYDTINQLSNALSPIFSFKTCGSYRVTLILRDTVHQLIDSIYDTLKIACNPIVTMRVSDSTGCSGSAFSFYGSVNCNGFSHSTSWDLGTGKIFKRDTLKNIKLYTIDSSGHTVYHAYLNVLCSNGCFVNIYKDTAVSLGRKPKAAFVVNNYSSCIAPATISLLNRTSSLKIKYQWLLPGGIPSTSTTKNPFVFYNTSGSFQIKLIATDSFSNCSDTGSLKEAVVLKSFTHNLLVNTLSCTNDTFLLKDSISGQRALSHLWEITPQINTSITNKDSQSYVVITKPGLYTLCETVFLSGGCAHTTCQTINVLQSPKSVISLGATPYSCTIPQTVFAIDSSHNSSYNKWTSSNTTNIIDTARNALFTFNSCGNKYISLVAYDSICSDTSYVIINVPCYKIHLQLGNAGAICVPEDVKFTTSIADSGVVYLTDTNGNKVGALLNFSDSFILHFTACGRYYLHVQMHNKSGCSDSIVQLINTYEKPKISTINFDTLRCHHDTLSFRAYVTSCNSDSISYRWYISDNNASVISGKSILTRTIDTGIHAIKFIVNDMGCGDTMSSSSKIHIIGPDANINIIYICKPFDSIKLNTTLQKAQIATWKIITSTNIMTDTGRIVNYSTHDCGDFAAKLRISDKQCIDSVTKLIKTRILKPSFSKPKGNVCQNSFYPFVNTSNLCSLSKDYNFKWKFTYCGDTNAYYKSLTKDTDQLRFGIGLANVQLIASSVNGCTDSTQIDTFHVNGLIKSTSVNVFNNCTSRLLNATFSMQKSCINDSLSNSEWQLSYNHKIVKDTLAKSLYNIYLDNDGSYSLKLITQDIFGCLDTINTNVQYHKQLIANIFVSKDTLCNNEIDTFTLEIKGAKGKVRVSWNFADGDSISNNNVLATHNFNNQNLIFNTYSHTFNVKVTVADSICDTVLVYPVTVIYPQGHIYGVNYPKTVCQPLKAIIADSFKDFKMRYWQFDAMNNSPFIQYDSNIAAYTYINSGKYVVRMIGITNWGCSDTLTCADTFSINPLFTTHMAWPPYSCVPAAIHASSMVPKGIESHWIIANKCYNSSVVNNDTITTPNMYTAQLVVDDSLNNCIVAYSLDTFIVDQVGVSLVLNNNKICEGEYLKAKALVVSINRTLSYSWKVDSVNYLNPSDSFTFKTTYTGSSTKLMFLVVATQGGCADSVQSSFVVLKKPKAIIFTPDSFVCLNQSIILIDSSTYTAPYKSRTWVINNKSDSTAFVISRQNAKGVFKETLIVRDTSACTDTALQSIYVLPLPVITHTQDTVVCQNSIITLKATGGKSYKWYPTHNIDSTNNKPIVQITDSICFYVYVTDTYGCMNKDSIRVSVWHLPHISVRDTSACLNDTLHFSVINQIPSERLTYKWMPSAAFLSRDTSSTPCLKATVAQAFTVLATDKNGCHTEDSIKLTVLALPRLMEIGKIQNCVNNCDTIYLSGAVTYTWKCLNSIKGSTNPLLHCQNVPGTYTYYIEGMDSNGCTNIDSINIKTFSKPTVSLSTPQFLCAGDTIAIKASGALKYTFIHPYALIQTYADNINVAPKKDTSYSVIGINSNGCSDTLSKTISVIPFLHSVVIPTDTDICLGAYVAIYASGGTNYYWHSISGVNNTDALILIQPTVNTLLYVTVSNKCFSADIPIHIRVHTVPKVKACANQYILNNQYVNLSAIADTSGVFLWTPSTSLTQSSGAIVKVHPSNTTTYFVFFTAKDGCSDNDSTIVYLVCNEKGITVPNIFTPLDPGGQNTKLMPLFSGDARLQLFMIYDRWGNKMFETHNQEEGWDGKFKGKMADQGVYAYYLEATCNDGKLIKSQGNITLLK